ncbi:MAG: ferrochelatase, partial [Gammaproteobacteria bacterium]|nr:ferrochelatase [Gammaproteobacteria bacterium]
QLLVLPLYPQFSATTTASTFDEVSNQLQKRRRLPSLQFISSYHDNPAYINALAESIRRQTRPESKLLFSFHGIPKRYLLNGDPYHCQCHKTARLVAQQLNLADDDWSVAFQSRLGREEWLRPYTDEVLPEWAKSGVLDVDVVCPGFAADCLETLEEVALRYRDLFLDSGGRSLNYIPALNDSSEHIQCLSTILEKALSAWDTSDLSAAEAQLTLERARRLGARQ